MSSETVIKVENLSKCYHIYDLPHDRLKQSIYPRLQRFAGKQPRQYFREFWALKDISFEIKKGETVGIIGRNGSGKSTLLQMICGTLNPTSGSIRTHGRIAALLELGSGFNPEFTGRENVYMNAAVLGLSKEETDARFEDIITFADIGDFVEQPVKTYSSGMFVRLAFAVIAHVDADILIVDEALAVGDAFFSQKCMRFLRNFMRTGTVLFVSHDTGAVANLCNKAILLDRGQAVAIGATKDVAQQYLASLNDEDLNSTALASDPTAKTTSGTAPTTALSDVREGLISGAVLHNDIDILPSNPTQSGFGTGNAQIISVRLFDTNGLSLPRLVGGEDVVLEVQCLARKDIFRPIIGFQFKDRLGQTIFGHNTFSVYQHDPRPVIQSQKLVAKFEFQLPILPTGDYSIAAAVAEGSQESHIQHHWLHDALIVRVHGSVVSFGGLSIAMLSIS